MSEPKKLTEAPKDLKEAIEWVIHIKGHAQELGKVLEELLKHDGSEVALKVLDKYRLASKGVISGLAEANLKIQPPTNRFYFAYTALNSLSQGLRPFHSQSQANINPDDVEKVGKWVSSVQVNTLTQPIQKFAEGLQTFQKGILTSPSNATAYNSAPSWSSLTDSEKRDCAVILLGIMPVVYIAITYLYWQCAGTGGWAQDKLNQGGSDQGTLKQYMEALGYQSNQLANKNGSTIISSIMNSMFSGELRTAYGPSQAHYFNFLKALQNKAITSIDSPSSPLTSLYLLSYYYTTNFLYTVQSTSPVTPSFAGYSGVAALAGGAYGFNLGGLGTFVSALLV
ncbi:variant erythrocyte surface antigen-1 family protein [Babesia caballi]|uniref:Variant erythrocyte surface antigen-1 family protein n=1 Tax=Babesia caballi TaxID=5871 RepID=A0AAV4M1D3_BABCB|nr:variant erythrocyte surface antigen-1 family protein [Babesia caballi]